MAINKKLIHFNKYDDFQTELNAGNILDKSIVFIKDRKQIYTHKAGYLTIPDGAKEGQVLGFKDSEIKWVDKADIPTLDDYVTSDYLESVLAQKADTSSIADMATKTWVTQQNYLTSHQSLTGYAKSTEVTSEINSAIAGLNISQYETVSGAASKYQPKGNYLTEHQSLTDYAKKTDLNSYLTTTAAANTYQPKGTYLTSHQDISGKADKSTTVTNVAYDTSAKKITKTINGTTTDVVTAAKIVTDGGGITSHQDLTAYSKTADTVSAVAINGNYLRVTKNGGNTDLTIPYATSANNSNQLGGVAASNYLTTTVAANTYQPKGSYLTAHQTLNTLTFSAGKFSAGTYNPSAAKTINIPTNTSHLTNDSGFLTSHQSLASCGRYAVAGTWTAYQDFTAGAGNSGSDMRFKEEVKPSINVLSDVLKLEVIDYIWNKEGESKKDTFGLNAYQLEELGGNFAKMVHERPDKEKTKWVEYDRCGVIALKAIQELYKIVEKQQEEINELKSRIK